MEKQNSTIYELESVLRKKKPISHSWKVLVSWFYSWNRKRKLKSEILNHSKLLYALRKSKREGRANEKILRKKVDVYNRLSRLQLRLELDDKIALLFSERDEGR